MKKLLFSVAASSILMLGTATPTFAAENIFQRIGNSISNSFQRFYLMLPGDKPGDAVMNQAMQASQDLKSADLNMTLTADVMKDDQTLATLKLNMTGPYQLQDPSDLQSYREAMNVTADATMQGTTLSSTADLRMVNKNVYIKINELPALPFFDLSSIQGKWLKFTPPANAAAQTKQLTPEQQQLLKDASTQLFKSAQFGPAKKDDRNGQPVFIVDMTIPKAAMQQYLNQVLITMSPQGAASDQNVAQGIQKLFDKLGDIKATVWVNRNSYNISHVDSTFQYPIDQSANAAAPTPAPGSAMDPLASLRAANKVQLNMTFEASNFNQPKTIDEPTDAQDAQSVIQNAITGSMMKGTGAGGAGMPPGMKLPDANQLNQLPSGTAPTSPSELPTLSPKQKQLLQQYQQLNTPKY